MKITRKHYRNPIENSAKPHTHSYQAPAPAKDLHTMHGTLCLRFLDKAKTQWNDYRHVRKKRYTHIDISLRIEREVRAWIASKMFQRFSTTILGCVSQTLPNEDKLYNKLSGLMILLCLQKHTRFVGWFACGIAPRVVLGVPCAVGSTVILHNSCITSKQRST